MTIEEAVSRVRPLDTAAMRAAEKRFSDIAMPLGGLGLLQAGCHGNSHPKHGTGKVHHVHDGEID